MGRNRRLELHEILCNALGSRFVYFSPPASIQMCYPCMVYELEAKDIDYADNIKYRNHQRWTVTLITQDPNDTIHDHLENLPYSNPGRPFIADGLYHFPYTIYL